MKNGYTRERMRRLTSLLLAVIVAVTFMPFLGDGSYAETNKKPNEKVKYIEKKADGTEVELDPEIFEGDSEIINPDDATLEKLGVGVEPEANGLTPTPIPDYDSSVADTETVDDYVDAGSIVLDASVGTGVEIKDVLSSVGLDDVKNSENDVIEEAPGEDKNLIDAETGLINKEISLSDESGVINAQDNAPYPTIGASVDPPSGLATLSGEIGKDGAKYPHYYFGWIEIDNEKVLWPGDYCKSITGKKVSMKGRTVGYNHTISVQVYSITNSSGTVGEVYYRNKPNVPAYMYSRPSSAGIFELYSTYMNYMPTNFLSGGLAIAMQYSTDGVHWAESGYMPYYYQTYTIKNLKPNTVYQTRIYFYQTNKIGGHNFNGAETGSFLYTGSFRTGLAKLPKIKSVKVKAYKVKKRRAGVYGWYTGYYFGSVKYYTYKIKVTVEFKAKKKKKRQGLNGLYINGVWKKGNKKKYTLKLGPYANYSKPRGKKFNVYLYSAHSPGGYGGYSPMYSKRKKVK